MPYTSREEILRWAEAQQFNYSCSDIPAKYRFVENHFAEIQREYYQAKKIFK